MLAPAYVHVISALVSSASVTVTVYENGAEAPEVVIVVDEEETEHTGAESKTKTEKSHSWLTGMASWLVAVQLIVVSPTGNRPVNEVLPEKPLPLGGLVVMEGVSVTPEGDVRHVTVAGESTSLH